VAKKQTKKTVKSIGPNCLVTNILQNIIFCVQQNATGLEQLEGQ